MKNLKGFCTFAVMAIIALFVWDLTIDRDFALFNMGLEGELSIKKMDKIFIIGMIFSAILCLYFFLTRNSSYKTAARIGLFAAAIGFVGFLLLYTNLEDLIKFDGSEYKSEMARAEELSSLRDSVSLGRMFVSVGYVAAMIAAAASLICYARTKGMKNILVGLTMVYLLPFICLGLMEYMHPDTSDYMKKSDSYYGYEGYEIDEKEYEEDCKDYAENWETIAKVLYYLQFIGWGLFFYFHEEGMQPCQVEAPAQPIEPEDQKHPLEPEEQKQE
jgi:hypothetical protein